MNYLEKQLDDLKLDAEDCMMVDTKYETDTDIEDEEFDDFIECLKIIRPVNLEKFYIYKEAFKNNRNKNVKFSVLMKSVYKNLLQENQINFDDDKYSENLDDIDDAEEYKEHYVEPYYDSPNLETIYIIEYLLSTV